MFDGLLFEGPLVVYATPSEYKTAMRGGCGGGQSVGGWAREKEEKGKKQVMQRQRQRQRQRQL